MTKNPKEADFVKAAVGGNLFTDGPRVVQTKDGTWPAHWCGVPGNTPPIEKRKWICVACFKKSDEIWRQIPPVSFIDWEKVENRIGSEDAKRAYNVIKNHIPDVWERIKNVEELGLKFDICCKDCKKILNDAAEALVEVY